MPTQPDSSFALISVIIMIICPLGTAGYIYVLTTNNFQRKSNIKNLTPDDFPGIDQDRFNRWKQLALDASWIGMWVILGSIFLCLIVSAMFGPLGELVVFLLLCPFALYLVWLRPHNLAKELGINKNTIQQAKIRYNRQHGLAL